MVDLIEMLRPTRFPVNTLDIVAYPQYQMIFKGAFDKLVKEVGSNELVNVGTGKVICKRLPKKYEVPRYTSNELQALTTRSATIPYSLHSLFASNASTSASVWSLRRGSAFESSVFAGARHLA